MPVRDSYCVMGGRAGTDNTRIGTDNTRIGTDNARTRTDVTDVEKHSIKKHVNSWIVGASFAVSF